jgi:hypothetical protein
LQAIIFNAKSIDCSIDPEYVEVKACSVKSLEHDTSDIDLNILFIKEMAKLQVTSNWTCYGQIEIDQNLIPGLHPNILRIFENQPYHFKFII